MESLHAAGLVATWDDAFYCREELDPVAAAAAGRLLLTPGLLRAAAEQDAAAVGEAPEAYVIRVLEQSVYSLQSTEESDGLRRVINHEGTRAALGVLGMEAGKGMLMLLTGSHSIGKSLMLAKMAASLSVAEEGKEGRSVLYVDARQYGTDLTRGIIAALVQKPTVFGRVLMEVPHLLTSGLKAVVESVTPPVVANAINAEITKYTTKDAAVPSLAEVLGGFFAACTSSGSVPVIIIDEANVAFKALPGTEAGARVLDELNLFARISKQNLEASIVLATSEHGLPFRLRALGFNTAFIGKTIIAEEVPPAVMKDELTRMWGCGEHLATALLALYGGHVMPASYAVRELATSTAPARLVGLAALIIIGIIGVPAACLSDKTLTATDLPKEDWAAARADVTEALKALVLHGSFPLESDEDKVAEIISLANAGIVIPVQATASGVPPEAWQQRTPSGKEPRFVLVPSSHIMRLLIAGDVFPPPI